MKIISLFSGAGGLDLGFSNAGFNLVFANDVDKDVWDTFEKNHKFDIDKRSIVKMKSNPKNAEKIWKNALKLLAGDCPKTHGDDDCEWCCKVEG